MTGIPAATLRNWEKRYGFPMPERSQTGHRLYTTRDVEFLKNALRLQREGRPLCELTRFYSDPSAEAPPPATVQVQTWQAPAYQSSPCDDVHYRSQLIYESILRFDAAATAHEWLILNAKLSPIQIFELVFEPLLIRLGREWAEGKISIAQEHYCSQYIRMKLGAFLTLEIPASLSSRVVLAGLTGEVHEGGLLLLACHLKFRGYPVLYFGVDLPVQTLAQSLEEARAHAMGVSYVSVERLRQDLPLLKKLPVPVVIGGQAILALSDNERAALQNDESEIFLSFEVCGGKAADFVEYVCQRREEIS